MRSHSEGNSSRTLEPQQVLGTSSTARRRAMAFFSAGELRLVELLVDAVDELALGAEFVADPGVCRSQGGRDSQLWGGAGGADPYVVFELKPALHLGVGVCVVGV